MQGGCRASLPDKSNWSTYNSEQQASIVEDWFSPFIGNRSMNDPRWRYIRENIRPGRPYA